MKKLSKILAVFMCLVMLMGTCSTLIIGAQAVTAPTFSFEQTSSSGTTVTAELKLKSGSFNSFDMEFIMPTGVTCTSIELADSVKASGVKNASAGKVSYSNTSGYSTTGTIMTVTFNIPSGMDIFSENNKIYAYFSNCSLCGGTSGTEIISIDTSYIGENGKFELKEAEEEGIFTKILNAIFSIFKFLFSIFTTIASN